MATNWEQVAEDIELGTLLATEAEVERGDSATATRMWDVAMGRLERLDAAREGHRVNAECRVWLVSLAGLLDRELPVWFEAPVLGRKDGE